jgi:hypothetical protein
LASSLQDEEEDEPTIEGARPAATKNPPRGSQVIPNLLEP